MKIAVDLFAGAGGFSDGARQAGLDHLTKARRIGIFGTAGTPERVKKAITNSSRLLGGPSDKT